MNDLLGLFQRIATLQMVPNLDSSDSHDVDKLRAFGQQLSPEMVQLFYQIALHGKRDLPYAADPKSGFEMMLLRMLSFQPTSPSAVTAHQTPKAAIKKATTPEPITEKKVSTIAPKAAEKPVTKPVEKIALKSTVGEIESKANSAILNSDNWLTIINGLKLTALARQLADNSAFISFKQDKITLRIAAELAHLTGKKPQERLEAVLSKHLGHTVSLVFQEGIDTSASSTVATERAEQASADQARAKASIHNDPAVDAMKEAFGARIIESTIKPIK
jgi:DNA polymerase-3 subunit gamma/tau